MSDEEEIRVWDGTVHASEFHAMGVSVGTPGHGCLRKYWRRYSGREAPIEKPNQRLGKSVHKICGDYLEIGSFNWPTETIEVSYRVGGEPRVAVYDPDKQVEIAQSAFHALPKPGEGFAEVPFSFEFQGVPFAGTIDYLKHSQPEIVDHKTTANLRYSKTTRELTADPQAIIYAFALRPLFGRTPVECTWSYMQTRTATKHRAVPFGFTSQQLDAAMVELAEIGRAILELHAENPDPMSFPPDPSECEKYGGCPYRKDCTDVSDLQISLNRKKHT